MGRQGGDHGLRARDGVLVADRAVAMSARTWHKGPPPHIGWWNASTRRAKDIWRWWNGKQWSRSAIKDLHVTAVERAASQKVSDPLGEIEWTDYYPENARVPRVAP